MSNNWQTRESKIGELPTWIDGEEFVKVLGLVVMSELYVGIGL